MKKQKIILKCMVFLSISCVILIIAYDINKSIPRPIFYTQKYINYIKSNKTVTLFVHLDAMIKSPEKYSLVSYGPNGKDDNGQGDDIVMRNDEL